MEIPIENSKSIARACKDGDRKVKAELEALTISLGSLFQHLTTPPGKEMLPHVQSKIPLVSFEPFSCVLS